MFRSLLLLGKWEDPKKASQKGELFESSVIQKRPFNVRTWGSPGENVAGIAVNYPRKTSGETYFQREKRRTFSPTSTAPCSSREGGGKVKNRGEGEADGACEHPRSRSLGEFCCAPCFFFFFYAPPSYCTNLLLVLRRLRRDRVDSTTAFTHLYSVGEGGSCDFGVGLRAHDAEPLR